LFNLGGITEVDAVGEADVVGTGRIKSVIHPMMAEITFGCNLFLIVIANGMVRAFVDAKLTPVAFFVVKDDDPVSPLRYGFQWACLYTGRLIAVPTDIHTPHEVELPVHQFRAIRPDRKVLDTIFCIDGIVLLLAGDFASLASPTGIFLDNQCISFHGWPPCFFSG
jgi:hypothetical protein